MPWHDVQICIGMWKEAARMKYILTCIYISDGAAAHDVLLNFVQRWNTSHTTAFSDFVRTKSNVRVQSKEIMYPALYTSLSYLSPFACYIYLVQLLCFILFCLDITLALRNSRRPHVDMVTYRVKLLDQYTPRIVVRTIRKARSKQLIGAPY